MLHKTENRINNRLTVQQDGKPIYDIVLQDSFAQLPQELIAQNRDCHNRNICIVTDSNVSILYLDQVRTLLEGCCKSVISFVFPAGEQHKNLDTVKDLYEVLITHHFDRKDWLVALGGGVVGDLCGFAAATYLRGISFIQLPTTLLSQVDSSIGGKTGVDCSNYKNMVGAFHMPLLVYANITTLLTLPEDQFSAGMGEVIKHGLIKDRAYYQWISKHRVGILQRDLELCATMVIGSNQIKRAVVEQDPTEQGDRALLNYGHTLGHAIEKQMGFRLLHGHCVALGALASAYLSVQRGMIKKTDLEDYGELMQFFQMPVTVAGLSINEVVQVTKNDKKMESGVIKFILLKEVGCAYIDRTVTEKEMEQALETILV